VGVRSAPRLTATAVSATVIARLVAGTSEVAKPAANDAIEPRPVKLSGRWALSVFSAPMLLAAR
jgi:hypothetical protein